MRAPTIPSYTPPELMQPRIPGEELHDFQPELIRNRRGLHYATSLIDKYYNTGNPEDLERSITALTRIDPRDPDQYSRALGYIAYMPIIKPRGQRTPIHTEQLSSTSNNLQIGLRRIHGQIDAVNRRIDAAKIRAGKQTAEIYMLDSIAAAVRRNGIKLGVGMLSVETALEASRRDDKLTSLLFLSTTRESDNELFRSDRHDLHTYNPERPGARVRVHVNTEETAEKPGDCTGFTYNFIETAQAAYADIFSGTDETEPPMTPEQAFDILTDPAMPDVRQRLATRQHKLISRQKRDVPLKITNGKIVR